MFDRIASFARKNQGIVAGLIVAVCFAAVALGCQPKAPSIIEPDHQVTRDQLAAEVVQVNADLAEEEAAIRAELEYARAEFQERIDALNARRDAAQERADLSAAALDRQAEALAAGVALVTNVIGTVAGPYAPLAIGALGILAAGLGIDNRRKDGVIAGQRLAQSA